MVVVRIRKHRTTFDLGPKNINFRIEVFFGTTPLPFCVPAFPGRLVK